jgi:hypothetical protein
MTNNSFSLIKDYTFTIDEILDRINKELLNEGLILSYEEDKELNDTFYKISRYLNITKSLLDSKKEVK